MRTSFSNAKDLFRRANQRHRNSNSRLTLETLEPRVVLDGSAIISEFLSSNDRTIVDEDGDDSDWVEIMNPTSESVSLRKWALTDDADNLTKWRFPDVELPPGEQLIVFASGKDRDNPASELHANFKLSSEGEYLALVEPDGQTVASEFGPTFPLQVVDVSYGISSGILPSTLIEPAAELKFLVPSDNSVDPSEPDAITGTWLDPEFDDATWATATSGIGFVPPTEPVVLADSATEFSGVQGQDNWFYGTWTRGGDNIFQPHEFSEMNTNFFRADSNKWDQAVDGAPFLEISSEGARPNTSGFFKQWAIRRWVSETAGEITISGTINQTEADGDGVVARILKNGDSIYETSLDGQSENYSISTQVELGDLIDFAVDAGPADDDTSDQTIFTSAISGLAFNPAPEVIVADSEEDWTGDPIQGADGWTYGYYNQTADGNGTYQPSDFTSFPLDFWNRNKWDFPASPPETEILSTSAQPNGVDEGGIVHWAIRRWTSDWDGPVSLNWSINKAQSGGDGVTGRILLNGVEIDSLTIAGDDRDGVTRTLDLENISSGDQIDLAIDPLGVDGDPAAPDGDRDRTSLSAQIVRKADLAIDINTDIRDAMLGSGSVYTRIPFDIADVDPVRELRLQMKYDGGFSAYINGKPVADQNAPETPTFDSIATEGRDAAIATQFQTFDLSSGIEFLVSGQNVLQIHGMNEAADGDNFLLLPSLEVGVQSIDVDQKRYFVRPKAGEQSGFGFDKLGPIVQDLEHTPAKPLATDPIVVSAAITPTFADVTDVTLNFRVMYGDTSTLPMMDDGTGGDAVANDGVYTATIPGGIAEKGQMVRWFLTADAADGTRSRGPHFVDPNIHEEYTGTVIHDPELTSNLPIFHWFVEAPNRAITDVGTRGSFYYDGEFYDNVSADLHGQSSRGFPSGSDRVRPRNTAKSYDFDFPNDHRFRLNDSTRRMDDFNLMTNYADQSLLRNTLAWEQHAFSGQPSLLAFPVRVHQNGEFFSLYDFVEDGDERWLERTGLDPEGSLYKMYTTFTASGNEKKSRTDEGIDDLREVVDGVRGDNRIEYVFDNIDLPAMVNFAVGMPLVSEVDCCHKNYYAYRDTNGTGEWSFLQWDEDLSQGRVWGGLGRSYFDDTIYHNTRLQVGDNNTLMSLLYTQVPGFQDMFMRRMRSVFDAYYTEPGTPYADRPFETRVDELYELMKDDAALHNEKNPVNWGQTGFRDFKESVDLLKKYMADRREWFYTTQLAPDDTGVTRLINNPEGKSPVKYIVPTDESAGRDWVQPGFNDAAWKDGLSAIGYEQASRGTDYSEIFETDVEGDMAGKNGSVYIRMPITVDSVDGIEKLNLRVKYDDGFVAYLNGTEIARDNAPDVLAFNSEAESSHRDSQAVDYENFDITEHLGLLNAGDNLLAIQAMNSTAANNDFLFSADLVSGEIVDGSGRVPAPQVGNPNLDFGKIEFQPASNNQEEEYIEIVNNNASAVDISGWSIAGDAEVTFKGGTVIPAGWTLYATPNAKAFRARAEGPSGGQRLFVYGNYDGRLPNAGGSIELRAADGEVVSSTSYVGETSNVAEVLRISEINYNPLNPTAAERAIDVSLDAEDFEFVEVVNTSTTETIQMDGVHFSDGILFDFTGSNVQQLAPGERAVVVKDVAAFEIRYGAGLNIAGTFAPGSGLANGSDTIELLDSSNSEVVTFTISGNGDMGWPERADGAGSSLVAIDLNADLNDPTQWRPSTKIHGTPGADAVAPITNVVINEVLSNGSATADSIELYNTSDSTVSLANYYLSDSANSVESLAAYALPAIDIDANGYLVFDDSQFNANDNGFGLSGTRGDQLYLTTGDGGPVHFVDNVDFPAAAEDESYGRVDGGWFMPLLSTTLGAANSDARVGPLVISEIQYNSGAPSQAAIDAFADMRGRDLEFVEIFNTSAAAINLTDWRIRGGIDMNFDADVTIQPNQALVVLPFNPERVDNVARTAAFRAHYGIDANVQLIGGFGNQINNGGERITLQRPGTVAPDQNVIPRLVEDEVIFSDSGAWPAAADGTGATLQRLDPNGIAIDPSNWIAATANPGSLSSVSPDLNGNGTLDEGDIQIVCDGLHSANMDVDFDGSGAVNSDDLVFFVNNIAQSSVGDSNLDGTFDSGDLVQIFQVGEYEDATDGNSTWAEGDWDCDGDFNSRDLVFAFVNGTFSRAAVAAPATSELNIGAALIPNEASHEESDTEPSMRDETSNADRALILEQMEVDQVFAQEYESMTDATEELEDEIELIVD